MTGYLVYKRDLIVGGEGSDDDDFGHILVLLVSGDTAK